MTVVAKILRDVIEQAETWPEEDQRELAEYARDTGAADRRVPGGRR